MTLSSAANKAAAGGAANALLAAAGNRFRVALFYHQSEVSGFGYSRQIAAALASASVDAGVGVVALLEPVTFSASGGSISFDQYKILNYSGTAILYASPTFTTATIQPGAPLSFMAYFRVNGGYAAPVMDLRNFNARLNGVDDDTQYVMDAIEAADAVGGVVYHPGGTCIVSDQLAFPANSSAGLRGNAGQSIFKAKTGATPFGPLLSLDSLAATAGSRYGVFEDFIIDGNDVATQGFKFHAVDRYFRNITISKCTRVGLYNYGSQNCQLDSIKCYDNGTNNVSPFPDCNYAMDYGARNNQHNGMQLTARYDNPANRGVYNLVICNTANNPSTGDEPCSYNKFYTLQAERVAQSFLGCVLQSAGTDNYFNGGTLHSISLPVVTINSADGVLSARMIFDSTSFSGGSAAIRGERGSAFNDGAAAYLYGANVTDNISPFFQVNDYSPIELESVPRHGGTLAAKISGTKTLEALITQYRLRLDLVPDNTTGVPQQWNGKVPAFYNGGSGGQEDWMYQGSWRKVEHTAP